MAKRLGSKIAKKKQKKNDWANGVVQRHANATAAV